MTVITGDCREVMLDHGPFDLIIADPPYGDTSLAWDRRVDGWEGVARDRLKPTGSMWVFGSMRFFMATGARFEAAGWRLAQDIVWEKHNGSGFHADRFKRVHEHVVQFYRDDAPWAGVFNEVQTTADAVQRTVNRKKGRPAHMGHIEQTPFASVDGGPRLMRSVIPMRSMHGSAIHPTEKPVGLLEILIRTSCPAGGLVGDFFAGSGAAGEAAASAGRRYIGAEIDPEMAAKARARLGASLFAAMAAQ
jgi:site-specific DNA-methyltransferase (adenine-specific)